MNHEALVEMPLAENSAFEMSFEYRCNQENVLNMLKVNLPTRSRSLLNYLFTRFDPSNLHQVTYARVGSFYENSEKFRSQVLAALAVLVFSKHHSQVKIIENKIN